MSLIHDTVTHIQHGVISHYLTFNVKKDVNGFNLLSEMLNSALHTVLIKITIYFN